MAQSNPIDLDCTGAPFDDLRGIRRLAPVRSGHVSSEHARHQLYVAHDRRSRTNVLIKVTSKPGVVYEHDLLNEIAILSTINRQLPESRYFPVLGAHGRLRDARVYLIMSLFDEWPLATSISAERLPARHVAHMRTAIRIADALTELHGLPIWHVDLNPMNIMSRWQAGKPIIRLVDFESSYDRARHANGVFYSPPTTSGFSAPELSRQPPDGRADVFSLAAVLYTMLAGFDWTWTSDVGRSIREDAACGPDLKQILLTAAHADPEKRYSSIVEFRSALASYLEYIWPGRSW